MQSNNIIAIILLIIAVLALYSVMMKETYCGCNGLGTMNSAPSYYTYSAGDVSLYPEKNLGWRTSMPNDFFDKNMKGDYWAAGADPKLRYAPASTQNGAYLTNYGSPCMQSPSVSINDLAVGVL